jgi:hypothetical protein
MQSFTMVFTIIVATSTLTVMLLISLLIIEHFCVLLVYLNILTMPKALPHPVLRVAVVLHSVRIQAHHSHNPACSSVYASRRSSIIDPYADIGGTVIDSAAKAAQYHASLSSFIVSGGITGQQESRSCRRFPAPFEFAVDETNDEDEVDNAVIRWDKSR